MQQHEENMEQAIIEERNGRNGEKKEAKGKKRGIEPMIIEVENGLSHQPSENSSRKRRREHKLTTKKGPAEKKQASRCDRRKKNNCPKKEEKEKEKEKEVESEVRPQEKDAQEVQPILVGGGDFSTAMCESLALPMEMICAIWVGGLSPEERMDGNTLWALVFISRRVCRGWRVGLEGLWMDILHQREWTQDSRLPYSFTEVAVEKGWANLREWALEQQPHPLPLGHKKKLFLAAAKEGQVDFMKSIGLSFLTKSVIDQVIQAGNRQAVLQCIFHANKPKLSFFALVRAAYHGKKGIIKLLMKTYHTSFTQKAMDNTMQFAARTGRLDIIQWLHGKYGIELSEGVASSACIQGHIDVLKWLKQNGCEMNEPTMEAAIRYGQTDIMLWLWVEQHCVVPLYMITEHVWPAYKNKIRNK